MESAYSAVWYRYKAICYNISSSFSKEMGSGLDNSDSNAGSGVWIFNIAMFLPTAVVYTQSSIQWVRSNIAKWLHSETDQLRQSLCFVSRYSSTGRALWFWSHI